MFIFIFVIIVGAIIGIILAAIFAPIIIMSDSIRVKKAERLAKEFKGSTPEEVRAFKAELLGIKKKISERRYRDRIDDLISLL